MGYKILKGAMVGILLGVCGGILLTSVLHIAGGGSVRDVVSLFREGNMKMLFAGQKISDEDQAELEAVFGDAGMARICAGGTETADGMYGNADGSADVYEDAIRSPEDVIVRFHVRANSDSEEDLALKYEVRDAVLAELADGLKTVEDDGAALRYIMQKLPDIRQAARAVVDEAGYDYTISAYIVREEFPIREYGELVLPAGTYRALRVDIGAAKGENFWCMLYPMMCYTMDAGAVVDSEDAEKLAQALDEENYEKLFVKRDTKPGDVKVKLKILEWLQDTF
ncbi:MAG: stage II sporulation protein R [Clostridium sp.]|nr:stage II sporulation protein R [Clostridium sp.]